MPPKTTVKAVRRTKRYSKQDPIPPVEQIAERVRWLRETGDRSFGSKRLLRNGGVVSREIKTLFKSTPGFPDGIEVTGTQVWEKDADGKDVPSTFRFDITPTQMSRLYAAAYERDYKTIAERMRDGKALAKKRIANKKGSVADEDSKAFARLLQEAKDDPDMTEVLMEAWKKKVAQKAQAVIGEAQSE
jgi:hypothetical protein